MFEVVSPGLAVFEVISLEPVILQLVGKKKKKVDFSKFDNLYTRVKPKNSAMYTHVQGELVYRLTFEL